MATASPLPARRYPTWLGIYLLLGLYLTVRGYRSFEGDQAYRLPLLLHRQDASLFATDPFVRAFDQFNPHRVFLGLLDVLSSLAGLPLALFLLFVLAYIFLATGLTQLSHAVYRNSFGPRIGLLTLALALLTRAGNIGTNHLFEPILLDRLLVFGLGWIAISRSVANPNHGAWWSASLIGFGALLHPSLGFLLAGLLALSWASWTIRLGGSRLMQPNAAIRGVLSLFVALLPALWLHGSQASALLDGLPETDFRLLSFQVQGPQHMLPHLWRWTQWGAWFGFPILAILSLRRPGFVHRAEAQRLMTLLASCLAILSVAWAAVEVLHHTRATIVQPFRLATVVRGTCLVPIAARVAWLWSDQGISGRIRALLIGVGLCGDWAWMLVVCTELAWELATELTRSRIIARLGLSARLVRPVDPLAPGLVLIAGLYWLHLHDTERGHALLLAALGIGITTVRLRVLEPAGWTSRRLRWAFTCCWSLPILAAIFGASPFLDRTPLEPIRLALVERCRFSPVPTDDLERLAIWSKLHTPRHSQFIGPPGPKAFRLWSERSVAFNRAASPYHAAGLADWADRFRAHVHLDGDNRDLAESYLSGRHELENRYNQLDLNALAELARHQGADHVLAAAPAADSISAGSPLKLLKIEGRYAVYRLREADGIASRSALNARNR